MTKVTEWVPVLAACFTAISIIWGVIVYIRQQKINNLQNLVSVFQRFSNNDNFIHIFRLCDDIYVYDKNSNQQAAAFIIQQLEEVSPENKLKYLALLEEVAVFAKNAKVLRDDALHLFKFQFHYLYNVPIVADAFWKNIGGGQNERTKDGWSYQRTFAEECNIA